MASTLRTRRRWTEEEDELLRREANYQLSQGSLKDWNRIAAKLAGRTNKDCRKRWSKVCENIKKGAWDREEDKRLRDAVQMYGNRWTQVARIVESRHADQCAKRWQHSLDPNVDHSEWKEDDDERLIAAVGHYGRNWKNIGVNEFPNRSTTDIKNRYAIVNRHRQRENSNASEFSSYTNSMGDQAEMEFEEDPQSEEEPAIRPSLDALMSTASVPRTGLLTPQSSMNISTDSDPSMAMLSTPNMDNNGQLFSGTSDDYLGHNTLGLFSWNEEPQWAPASHSPENISSHQRSGSLATPNEDWNMTQNRPSSRTTLTLEDVQPETLNDIVDILFKSRTKVKMETCR